MILSHHARALQLFGYLSHLQKNISKICDFLFFSFDLCTGIILKQLNKIKNMNIFLLLFHFSFFFVVSRYVSPLCFPIVVPVVLPRCSPHCGATGTAEATGNCSLSFSTNARARWRKTLTPTRCIGITAPGRHHGETQRGDTTGKQNGETKRETKWKNENGKKKLFP